MTSICFLPLYRVERASSRYRVYQFLPALQRQGYRVSVLPAPENRFGARLLYLPRLLPRLLTHDVLFIQKRMFPLWLLALVKRWHPRIIFDLDDAVYLRPQYRSRINGMLAAATAVIVGNEELGAYARQHNANVVVIPSVVDTEKYRPPSGFRHPQDDRVIIGWLGSDPNRGDFEGMQPVLNWLADTHGEKVGLRVIGRRPLALETRLTLEFVRWSLSGSLSALQQFDIGIMPLADTAWNRGKCGFKLIQYLATGIPAVTSPVGVNPEIVLHGKTGYLADSENAWRRYLSILIADAAERRQLGRNGRLHVVQKYSITAVLPRLQQVIDQVAA